MKIELFSIKDTKVAFMKPIGFHNEQHAIRDFAGAVNDNQPNFLNQNIEDMQIWKLGTFDDQTGELTSEIKFLANATSLKRIAKEQNNGENSNT